MIVSILVSILFFSLLILVHEFGHFFTAKLSGINVEEFSIGMGPALLKRRKGETLYALRAFPIGGFVKLEGEDGDGENERSFNYKPFWPRFLVLFSGAGMNFLTAFLISLGLIISMPKIASNTIDVFHDGAVSSQYGLQEGDQLLKIGNSKIRIYTDIVLLLSESDGKPLDITVKRAGKKVVLTGVQFPVDTQDGTTYYSIDFYLKEAPKNVLTVVQYSFNQCIAFNNSIWRSLAGIFTGKVSVSQLSGPVGTTKVIGEAAKAGLSSLMIFFMFISINLGIMNLLPIPALDGGRILMLLIEKVRGVPMNPKYEGLLNLIGFASLMLLMVVLTFKDVITW